MTFKQLLTAGVSTLVLLASPMVASAQSGHATFRSTDGVEISKRTILDLQFAPQAELLLGGVVTSAPALYSGPSSPAAITSTNGEIRICEDVACSVTGSWSTSAQIRHGNYVQARRAGPLAPRQMVAVSVSVLNIEPRFEATARSASPSFGTFASAVGEAGAALDSNLSAFRGWVETPIAVSNGEYRLCPADGSCGSFTTANGIVKDGDQVQLRGVVAGVTPQNVVIAAGGAEGTFSVRALNRMPDTISFPAIANADPAAPTLSAVRVLSGHDGIDVSISGHPSSQYRICETSDCSDAGDAGWTTGTTANVQSGRYVQVRVRPAGFLMSASALLQAGEQSASFQVTARARDLDPDAYAFPPVTGSEIGAYVMSATQALTGHDGVDVSVSGTSSAQYRICTSDNCADAGSTGWTSSTTANVPSGRFVQVRVRPGDFSSNYLATLQAGSRSANFSVTTRDGDVEPDAFTFANVTNADAGAYSVSAIRQLNGHEGIPVSVSGHTSAQYRICMTSTCSDTTETSWTQETTQGVAAGRYVQVRLRPVDFSSSVSASLQAGSRSVPFTVTTSARDTLPDAFSFDAVTNAEPGVQRVTLIRPLRGHQGITLSLAPNADPSAQYQVCALEDCSDMINSGWTSGQTANVANGRWVRLRVTPPAGSYAATTATTLQAGAASVTWNVTTRERDVTPNPFTIAARSGVEPGIDAISNIVQLSGHDGIAVSVAAGADPSFGYQICQQSNCSDQGATTWQTGATPNVPAGRYLRVKLQPQDYGDAVSGTIVTGSVSTPYTATARVFSGDAGAISDFDAVTGAAPSAEVQSVVRYLTGFDSLAVNVSGAGASYRLCGVVDCSDQDAAGGGWGTAETTITSPSFVQLRTTSGAADETRTAILSYGARAASWSVTTRDANLYAFTTHTFTPCGETGATGPSLANCTSAYNTAWARNPAYYGVNGGVQTWTVPATGTYQVRTAGAAGGQGRSNSNPNPALGTPSEGGAGAVFSADLVLQQGEVINIVVGQKPPYSLVQTSDNVLGSRGGGGGGGSFAYRGAIGGNGLIAAGGGGGGGTEAAGASRWNGCDAMSSGAPTLLTCAAKTNNGNGGKHGTEGTGANAGFAGGGGAGWLGNGSAASDSGGAGSRWIGGTPCSSTSASGGFGGGAGSCEGAGGGGGYTGGDGGIDGNVANGRGGSGGSQGTYRSLNTGQGYVTITRL